MANFEHSAIRGELIDVTDDNNDTRATEEGSVEVTDTVTVDGQCDEVPDFDRDEGPYAEDVPDDTHGFSGVSK